MAKKIKEIENTGFGNNANNLQTARIFNKSGELNVKKVGQGYFANFSSFHTIIKAKWHSFILITFLAFVGINLLFTLMYLLIGTNGLSGLAFESNFEKYSKVFFFSIQTFTTVGYGNVSPASFGTGVIASIQAFVGLLFFALVTGLLYAKFSKPRAYVKFSKCALISPFKNATALMFRLVPLKNNTITNAHVSINLALVNFENGQANRRFYTLSLEIERINSLALSWTIVHSINEDSPLFGIPFEKYKELQFEALVFFTAYDEDYSNKVNARTSYTAAELKYGYKFEPMFQLMESTQYTTLDISKLNDIKKVDLA